jgi:hypothetical protein
MNSEAESLDLVNTKHDAANCQMPNFFPQICGTAKNELKYIASKIRSQKFFTFQGINNDAIYPKILLNSRTLANYKSRVKNFPSRHSQLFGILEGQ